MVITEEAASRERAEDVTIYYSDSAVVRIKIESPVMYRYTKNRKSIEEFPNGLKVEFLDDNQKVSSWLEADYALRKESEQVIIVKENVVLHNRRNDKLETEELLYNSKTSEISTDKYVRITQPINGDTSHGYGFITDQDFNRFEIKNRYSGIKKMEELESLFEGN